MCERLASQAPWLRAWVTAALLLPPTCAACSHTLTHLSTQRAQNWRGKFASCVITRHCMEGEGGGCGSASTYVYMYMSACGRQLCHIPAQAQLYINTGSGHSDIQSTRLSHSLPSTLSNQSGRLCFISIHPGKYIKRLARRWCWYNARAHNTSYVGRKGSRVWEGSIPRYC